MIPPLHRWVSVRALRAFGFSPRARRLVGETSRWTDWYRWNDHAANAATLHRPDGTPQDPVAAAALTTSYLRAYLQRLADGPISERFVWLGFALHLVQDLASHQGRTDPEHTFQLFLMLPNPDWSPAAVRRGLDYSRRLLGTLRQRLGPGFDELRRAAGARRLTSAEAERLLGPKDFSLPALFETLAAARLYLRTPRAIRRVRWDTEAVLSAGLAT